MARPAGGLGGPFNPQVQIPPNWVGHAFVGQRLNVPVSSVADIWGGPTLTRPLPLAAKGMSIKSSSASDAFPASGATLVLVTWMDDAGDWRWSDILPTTGTTPVPITYKASYPLFTDNSAPFFPSLPDGSSIAASVFRIQSIGILAAAGATEALPKATNIGDIDVVDTATATVIYDRIPAGRGVGQSAAFSIPRGFEGLLTKWSAGTERGSGRISFAASLAGSGAWQFVTFSSIDSATAVFESDPPTTPIPARTDFLATVRTSSNNIDVSSVVQLRLRPLP